MDENLTEVQDVSQILRLWEEEQTANNPNYDPEETLTRLAEIIEAETESYMKMDPDPFDERHPSRVDPECPLGQILKIMFRKDTFMNKLVNDYLRENYWSRLNITNKDSRKLNIAACRLTLDVLPGLEVAAVFQLPEKEGLMLRLFSWAEKSVQPLQAYATGLLAAAMEVQDIAANFREQNARLVPLKIQELHRLQRQSAESRHHSVPGVMIARPFAHLGQSPEDSAKKGAKRPKLRDRKESTDDKNQANDSEVSSAKRAAIADNCVMSPPLPSLPVTTVRPSPGLGECSNSSWAEMESFVIGSMQVHPLTLATNQMLILRYLTPMGEYQELLGHVFEQDALELILNYVNVRETKDSRLAFEALKYLAALLCHKKFSIEFINMRGLQILLKVPRPSIAATGVSICLYYLAYCEDAMERVSQLPHNIIVELVKYSLWLLECSHDSGRCHATMFFGLSFQFRVILAEFDAQDGLRKLYNIISTLPILSLENESPLNEDEVCSARQIVRHVCVSLKRYLEAHLCIRAETLRRSQFRERGGQLDNSALSCKTKSTPDEVSEQSRLLLEMMPFRAHWDPVDQLLNLGGVLLLLQIIAFTYEWNYNGRAETVRSALDALAVCSLVPQAQMMLCEKIPVDLHLREERITFGINIILGAAEGEIAADSDVQRAALNVLINCVCAPIHRPGSGSTRNSAGSTPGATPAPTISRKRALRSSEDMIERLWESVRNNNGIMVLLLLMMVKTPITDADSIRALACQALAGLARSETVRQIVSKLPLFSNGQFQLLMRDPVLQDKRHEHVTFQKHAFELMERVLGKSKPTGQELETSLANMHRANVVAQTHIRYNDRQLYQLIHQHLLSRGLSDAAAALHREASLPGAPIKVGSSANFPPLRPRLSFGSPGLNRVQTGSPGLGTRTLLTPSSGGRTSSVPGGSPMGPPLRISLNVQRRNSPHTPINGTSRSLQKQISAESAPMSPMPKNPMAIESHVTLDSIVTEYLTNQHALCKNPVVPCPQFNLFEPHKCPNPKVKNLSPLNVATRLTRQPLGGPRLSARLDRRLVHSRFCPVRTFRPADDEGFYSCCTFLPDDKYLLVGSYQGDVKKFNLLTGAEENTYQCHESYIFHLEASRTSQLLLTSATWRSPQSAVWSIGKVFEQKFTLDSEAYIEFSKVSQDRIIGTLAEDATIYDVATGKKLLTLKPEISNQYTKNRATFSPMDELVLSDGVLWDVNSGKEIHKLDKLNSTTSGVFHPCGLEVVSNTEVWDLRTFHLLRTVPLLDQCDIQFSPGSASAAIYSISLEQEMEEETAFESSFKTFDAHDYTSIATIDVKKNIYGLATNSRDTQIAVVENQGVFDSVQESSVRVYDVGRRRDDDDEGEEEEDDEDVGSDDGSGSVTDDDQQDNAANGANFLLAGNLASADEDDDEDDDDDDDDDDAGPDDLATSSDSDSSLRSLSEGADSDEYEALFFD